MSRIAILCQSKGRGGRWQARRLPYLLRRLVADGHQLAVLGREPQEVLDHERVLNHTGLLSKHEIMREVAECDLAVCVDEQCYPALATDVPLVGMFFEYSHLDLIPVDYAACTALYPSLGGDPGTISPTDVADRVTELLEADSPGIRVYRAPSPPRYVRNCMWSVIVFAHDSTPEQTEATRRCIESIRANTTVSHEIVVVDRCSRPETVDMIRTQQDLHGVFLRDSGGTAGAVRAGLQSAHGDLLVLLHNDQTVGPGWEEGFIEAFEQGAVMAGTRAWRLSVDGVVASTAMEARQNQYDAANELLTETTGGETTYYHCDACGNTTVKQEPSGTTYYHWDHENLMTRLDLPDGGHSYFAYDADSKRVSKRDSDGFTEFIYQGPDMLRLQMERDEAGETRVRYTMGSGLEAMRRASNGIASGDSSFYHFDWLGSTFELTDESQRIANRYSYNTFGVKTKETAVVQNPLTFGGRSFWYECTQSLLGVMNTYYDTGLSRFLSDSYVFARLPGGSARLHSQRRGTLLSPAAGVAPPITIDACPPSIGPVKYVPFNGTNEPKRGYPPGYPKTYDSETPTLEDFVTLKALIETAYWWGNHGKENAAENVWHWLSQSGNTQSIDLQRMYREEPPKPPYPAGPRGVPVQEARQARDDAVALGLGVGRHKLVSSSAWRYGLITDNWRWALNTVCVHGVADVCITQTRVIVEIDVWWWDPYVFDYSTSGLGHLHSAGLARDYMNEARDSRTLNLPRR